MIFFFSDKILIYVNVTKFCFSQMNARYKSFIMHHIELLCFGSTFFMGAGEGVDS